MSDFFTLCPGFFPKASAKLQQICGPAKYLRDFFEKKLKKIGFQGKKVDYGGYEGTNFECRGDNYRRL
jgi:hypothetical protein